MTKTKKTTGSKEARRKSLRKVLQVLGLNERPAAELFGIPYSKLNNITRSESRSSLDEDLALRIQAATGTSKDSLMHGDAVPVMLNGKPLSKALFDSWRSLEMSQETMISQASELGFMTALLLEAAGSKGINHRRRMYHLMRELLGKLREEAGISMNEIHEQARKGAQLKTYTATRAELDEAIGKFPAYQAIRNSLPEEGSIQIVQESFPTWADPSDFESFLPEVPDRMEVTFHFYRIQGGDVWHFIKGEERFQGSGLGLSIPGEESETLDRKGN